jgi:uncharacterized membrane protein YdjX (TVP38/TMEM64 family)
MGLATDTSGWRRLTLLRWALFAAIAVGLTWVVRVVPVGPMLAVLRGWVEGSGSWGPVVFGLLDVLAVVALVPGSALTLAAGALFGLTVGTIVASVASTTGAALSFLIARYLARGRVEALAGKDARFAAIDRAIAAGGWKVVALLRLSPAVPFNLQNYLYGLTGIRFWPYLLTSWVAMLPGTFLYVSLGHAGRAGLEAASGGESRVRTPAEWAFLVVGLLATVAVTVYVTRLARKALRQRAEGDASGGGVPDAREPAGIAHTSSSPPDQT